MARPPSVFCSPLCLHPFRKLHRKHSPHRERAQHELRLPQQPLFAARAEPKNKTLFFARPHAHKKKNKINKSNCSSGGYCAYYYYTWGGLKAAMYGVRTLFASESRQLPLCKYQRMKLFFFSLLIHLSSLSSDDFFEGNLK